jgi:hypothetical protein
MIGTLHKDFRGPQRLENALNLFNPDVIISEGSQSFIDAYLRRVQLFEEEIKSIDKTFKESYLEKMKSLVCFAPYETIVSKNFAERNKKFHYFFDDGHIEEGNCVTIGGRDVKMFTRDICTGKFNLGRCIRQVQKNIDLDFNKLRSFHGNRVREEKLSSEWEYFSYNAEKRKKIMKDKLYKIIEKHPKSKIVCVNGLWHILRSIEQMNLYSQIEDLEPVRFLNCLD